MRHRSASFIAAVVLMAAPLAGCSWGLLRGYAEGPSALLVELESDSEPLSGATRMAFDDLGALNTDAMETHAVPWKVLVAALLVDHRRQGHEIPLREDAAMSILQEFGFIVPETILNMGRAPQPERYASPVGLLRGRVSRGFPRVELEVANLGCASCHSGVTYDAIGNPQMAVWLGLPNTSLNLDGLTEALFSAFSFVVEDPDQLLAALDSIYPAMDASERRTLEGHVLPKLVEETRLRAVRWGGLTPYAPGGPGAANGLGALQHVLGLVHSGRAEDAEGGAVGTPDLGDRVMKRALASDATFVAPGEVDSGPSTREDLTDAMLDAKAGVVAFFTVTTMGVRPDQVAPIVPRVRDILDFLKDYRPPPFPGEVNRKLAAQGEALFGRRCARCHGDYTAMPEVQLERYPNKVVPIGVIGTDPVRWKAATQEVADLIQGTQAGELLSVQPTDGYMAPPLTGIWATAPYLHNGSVPTIWHLMHPEQRPERFEVGGHRLDFRRLGIDGQLDGTGDYRYPREHAPWSKPVLYDTRRVGQSNLGHDFQFVGLDEREKRALIEYLKLL